MFLLCLSPEWKAFCCLQCNFYNVFTSHRTLDTGTTLRCIKAFSNPVNQLLFSSNDPKAFVASSTHQIKIYDLDSFVRRSEYSPNDDARINLVKIIPNGDRLLIVLHNNVVCVLTNSLKLIRHFKPLKARDKYLQKSNQKMEKLNYIYEPADDDGDDADVDRLIKSVTRDYLNGIIQSVSFSLNGNSFCMSLLDNTMLFCSTSMWDVQRVIEFPDFYIKQCDFITFTHEFNPNMLLTQTSNDDLMLINLKDLNSKMLIDMNNSAGFALSPNGQLLMNIQRSGEVFVYNLQHCVQSLIDYSAKGSGKIATENFMKLSMRETDGNAEFDSIQTKVINSKILFHNNC